MNTTEKLQRIRARCVELLELASKRKEYPHKWEAHGNRVAFWWGDECHFGYWLDSPYLDEPTAKFIAASAGRFEASLKSTIAAIDVVLSLPQSIDVHIRQVATNAILAAWPDELTEEAEK